MKTYPFFILLSIIISVNIPFSTIAQDDGEKYHYEDVKGLTLQNYDGMKEGQKFKWTAINGNTYGIKFNNN